MLEQIVLYTAKYTDGYGNLRDILVEFEDITGIETANIGSGQYRNVLGNSYADYAELEKDLNRQSNSGGGSGGGGGSNGSGKDKNNTASDDFSLNTEIIAPPAIVPLEKVYFNDLDNYNWAKEAGFTNINVDLMLGLPNQTITDLIQLMELQIMFYCYS